MAVKVPTKYGLSSYSSAKWLTVTYQGNTTLRNFKSDSEVKESEFNSAITQLQSADREIRTALGEQLTILQNITPSLTKQENGLYFCFGYIATTSSALALIIDCNKAIPSDYEIDIENTVVRTLAIRLINGKYVENNSAYPVPDSETVSQNFTITADGKSIRIILTKLNDAVWTDGTNTVTDKTPVTGSLRMDLQFKKVESGG